MNLAKINPWNWFKHEEAEPSQQKVPITRNDNNALMQTSNSNSLLRLHHDMNQLFNNVFSSWGMPSVWSNSTDNSLFDNQFLSQFRPNIDVLGDEHKYQVTLDVPGLKEENLTVELSGEILTIKGQKEESYEEKDKHFYHAERSVGAFQRTLALPDDANKDDITANIRDGVLTLDIPRYESEKAEVKRINISS
jgi:HSP20 family protein